MINPFIYYRVKNITLVINLVPVINHSHKGNCRWCQIIIQEFNCYVINKLLDCFSVMNRGHNHTLSEYDFDMLQLLIALFCYFEWGLPEMEGQLKIKMSNGY